MGRFRLAAALLGALLFAPVANAANADGVFEVGGPLGLAGESTLDADAADLLWERGALPLLALSAQGIEIERFVKETTYHPTPLLGDVYYQSTQRTETATHAASDVTLDAGAPDALVLVRAGRLSGATLVNADAVPVEGRLLAYAGYVQNDAALADGRCDDSACAAFSGGYELATQQLEAALAGDLQLYLHGATLVVREGGETLRYESGVTEASTGTLVTRQESWLVVRLRDAEGTVASDGPALVYAALPTLRAASVTLSDARGDLSMGLREYRASTEEVQLAGDLVLAPGAVARATSLDIEGVARYADSFTVAVSGDVAAVNLRALPVYEQGVAGPVGAAALLAAALGALAYFWPHVHYHATAALLPLYSRLKQPHILENEVRNHIYEIIRTTPGISAREIHRRSAQSWGTVVYHLRQLERHHLVVSRSVGRTRNYYENHGKYRGMEVQLACLQSARARALARLVLATPGVSQEDLVARSGLPQPTTSYYVRKLKGANLVDERREGRYARYHPNADLARFLELADDDQPRVGFSSGADA